MKKNLLLIFLLIGSQIQAQTILNIYSVPANPTTADSVTIFADCQFNSGTCNQHTQGHGFMTATDIGAWALHCLGALTVICTHTDTFPLGILPAGNYNFTFTLDEGFGGPPCTPGIVPGPNDTYSFTVSLPTSMEEQDENAFTMYPNPANSELRIQNAELRIKGIDIYSAFGKKLSSQQPTASSQEQVVIDVSAFPTGIYFVQLKTADKSFGKMFSVQR
jgi:hypothetical protein